MTVGSHVFEHRRLRAPRQDGGIFCQPPADAWSHLLSANAARLAHSDVQLGGRPLAEVAQQARGELIDAALAYTRQYRDAATPEHPRRIVLAGHQAEMFHPGVWAKHACLDRLARDHQATAVNLIVDTDTLKQPGIWVPSGTLSEPTRTMIPFDRGGEERPAEERTLVDASLWQSFGQRVAGEVRPFIAKPLIQRFWPLVLERTAAGETPALAIAQARHLVEGDWGLSTLELPLSATCGSEAFHWFAAHLLFELPRLLPVYNQAVAEYRRLNRIRSSSHPVPDLAEADGWREAPLWIWTADSPRRRRVFAQDRGGCVALSDRAGLELCLPKLDGDARRAVEVLADAAGQGIKLRTRALTTTLWARLLLGDVFVHGIGGAKYDQLTDALLARGFGIQPPGFVTFSATALLPIPRPQVSAADWQRVQRQLRELRYNPDRMLDVTRVAEESNRSAAAQQVEAKRRWIETPRTAANARERHQHIDTANVALQAWVAGDRQKLLAEQAELTRALRAAAVLGWREYSFGLFPEEKLRDFLLAIPQATL